VERKCRKLRTGKVAWSPSYQQAVHKIRYLKSCVRYYHPNNTGSRISTRTLHRQQHIAQIPAAMDYAQATTALKEVFSKYNQLKGQDQDLRLTHLQDLLLAISEQETGDPKNIYDQLITREHQRDLSRKLKNLAGKSKNTLTRVELYDSDNKQWVEVGEKQLIERGCIQENVRRFTQAKHTPSLLPESISQLGWTATTELASAILLNENIDESDLHPSIRRLAPYLGTPASIQNLGEMRTDIDPDKCIASWQHTREFTTTFRAALWPHEGKHTRPINCNYRSLIP
jgi:hypothetical protein